jgi:nicotinamide mononucleotide transporter
MLAILSIENVMVTIGDYPLSYIEFVGTVLYFSSVWLIARKNMLTWPVGIVSVLLYALLFYQIQLHSDAIEQVYYLGVSGYGWFVWKRSRDERPREGASRSGSGIHSSWSGPAQLAIWAGLTMVLALAMTAVVARLHLWLPRLFPIAADYPFLDALTTVMSFVAMFLMARRRTESWIYWIIVDVIGIGLYWVKDVRFISLQYVALLAMAIYGFFRWIREEPSGDEPMADPSIPTLAPATTGTANGDPA